MLLTRHKISRSIFAGSLTVLALCVAGHSCWRSSAASSSDSSSQFRNPQRTVTTFAARRAADDSRPLVRVASGTASRFTFDQQPTAAESQDSAAAIVMGKFKAPAPSQMQRQRIPKSSNFATQTVSASYQVADAESSLPEKIVHGITGNERQQQSTKRTVSAKIQVSDEGLNYPPSKVSADIYGNVAEIVTAPPEAVDNDFLLPQSNRFGNFGRRP